jgi:branched-chain amino acid transport system substrate-binding protein
MKFKSVGLAALLGFGILGSPAFAGEVAIGLLNGITGGAAAMAPEIGKAYDLAVQQINEQGGILKGDKLVGVVADDGCTPQMGSDAASKVVNVSHVIGIVGPLCSGATMAAANAVTIPAGLVLISPAATSPAISSLKDNDLVFRTAPSDEYQGQALARTLLANGTKKVAVSYLNNDYGKGLAEAFKKEFEAKGGTIAGYAGHEESRSSYRSDLAELAKGGADTLMIFDYGDTSGLTILREALENSFFKHYVGSEGMKTSAPLKALGAENLGTFTASSPLEPSSPAVDAFKKQFKAAGGNPDSSWTNTSYDAVFALGLAIQKANGDKSKISASLRAVTNGEGEPILPGEWKKAKELIAAGKPITYRGASGDFKFDANGDVAGSYGLYKVAGDGYKAIGALK